MFVGKPLQLLENIRKIIRWEAGLLCCGVKLYAEESHNSGGALDFLMFDGHANEGTEREHSVQGVCTLEGIGCTGEEEVIYVVERGRDGKVDGIGQHIKNEGGRAQAEWVAFVELTLPLDPQEVPIRRVDWAQAKGIFYVDL